MGTTATVGVGVIGTGFGRRVVAPVFAATEGCEVVDVVSPRDERGVRARSGACRRRSRRACTRRRSCTRGMSVAASRRARPCCATSRSRSTPTRRGSRWKRPRRPGVVALLQLRVPLPPGRAPAPRAGAGRVARHGRARAVERISRPGRACRCAATAGSSTAASAAAGSARGVRTRSTPCAGRSAT